MKKGTLRFIPLQAELCLNKQKVDISDFKGWQKCNAPVYGGCLSPLYKKNNAHHDIYNGDDYYDFENGVLSKNGTPVLSGSGTKKLKKTKINQDYSSLAVSDDGLLTYAKETSSNTLTYSIHGAAEQNVTVANCTRIICVKAFERHNAGIYGIVVWYLHTNGNYGYLLIWEDNDVSYSSYGASSPTPTTWSNFNVVSPLIQLGIMGEHKFLVSFFGTSGANLSATDVRCVYVEGGTVHDNPSFFDSTHYPVRYQTTDAEVSVEVTINQKGCNATSGTSTSGTTFDINAAIGVAQELVIWVSPHKYPVTVTITDVNNVPESFVFPPSEYGVTYDRLIGYRQRGTASNIPKTASGATISWTNNFRCTGWVDITGIGSEDLETNGLQAKWENDTVCQSQNYLIHPYFYTRDNACKVEVTTQSAQYVDDPNISGESTVTHSVTVNNRAGNNVRYTSYGDTGAGYHAIDDDEFWEDEMIYALDTRFRVTYGWGPYGNGGGGAFLTGNRYQGRTDGWDAEYWTPAAFPSWITYPSGYTPQTGKDGVGVQTTDASNYNGGGDGYGWATPIPVGYKYKVQYTESSLKEVDCCMDDGKLYCVGNLSSDHDNPLPTKMFGLEGDFVSYDSSTNKITYSSTASFNITYDDDDETNVFPKYYQGMSVSIQNHYLRVIYLFKAKKTDTALINIMIDSLAIAEGQKASFMLPGIKTGTNENVQGGIKNTIATEGWRLLFNNNMLSNVACYEKKQYIGTILADWFTIDPDFCIAYNSNTLYYKDNNNAIWKLELVTQGHEWEYKYIEDRYVVLNTTNYYNCYDMKTGKKRHWASDYNNRVIYGYNFNDYTNNAVFAGILTAARFSGLIITAQNANYEVTKDTISGLELGAVPMEQCLSNLTTFLSCEVPYGAEEGIELYRGDSGSTGAIYICSFVNGLKYVNNDLTNPYAVYPISQNGNVRYNPNLFTQFIKSYNNKDMVISDGIAYKLVYFNNVIPIMAYYMLDGVEELTGAFVLQTSYYGVSATRLYQMNYSNGVGVEVVADITGLDYLGALPSQALFWSAQNRAIYSFKGNCIMQLMQYANELTGIYGKWYNPATQELFLDTNIGILVFSDLGTYCLEWSTETNGATVSDIFFFKDRFIINLINDRTYSYGYSYNKLENYESNNILILTKYYGNGLVPVTINNVYIRLYNQSVARAAGSITFKGHTITDIGSHTDTKEIQIGGETNEQAGTVEGVAWDTETDTMLVKYTPQYNRGLGFALEVKTTFPIIDIKFDYVENGAVESQIAHINI